MVVGVSENQQPPLVMVQSSRLPRKLIETRGFKIVAGTSFVLGQCNRRAQATQLKERFAQS